MQNSEIINQFQNQALAMISSLLPLSSAVFFLVEPDMKHRGTVVFNSSKSMDRQYTASFGKMDPLSPERFDETDDRVVTLDSCIAPHLLKQTIYFQDFMVPHNHRYVADMFFRSEGRVMAVLTMLREASIGNFTADELAVLRKLQPFVEYSLKSVYLPERKEQRGSFIERFRLTEREVDVVELLIAGRSNKEIAAELSLGLATIKTHLHHIFNKTSVQNRSELVALALRTLQGDEG